MSDTFITLYVDKLSPDKSIGITENAVTIAYNNKILGEDFTKAVTSEVGNYNQGSFIGYAGRYIITIDVILDTHQFKSTFIDCKKNRDSAISFSKHLEGVSVQTEFISAFDEQIIEYDTIKDSVVLLEGIPPSTETTE